MDTVIAALNTLRVGKVIEEYDLQAEVAKALGQAGIGYQKEYQLGPGSRVDFLTDNGVAVEVKKSKPNRTRLVNQINRYAQFEEVKAVIIVVETSLRVPVTSTENGKPCAVVGLQKLWGIAI